MGNLCKREEGKNGSQVLPLSWMEVGCWGWAPSSPPRTLRSWHRNLGTCSKPQGLYLKHVKIHRAGLCQDFIASGRVKSHFVPSFSAVPPQVFQGGGGWRWSHLVWLKEKDGE